MQFLFLIIINVVMGAIFYLIITLKLEKSASQFKEQKLRREMDEIIKEFNAAADRNISLLENRISVLKKMLEVSGDKKHLDVILSDEPVIKNKREEVFISDAGKKAATVSENKKPVETGESVLGTIWGKVKKNMQEQYDKYKTRLSGDKEESQPVADTKDIKSPAMSFSETMANAIKKDQEVEKTAGKDPSKGRAFDVTLEKDLSHIKLDNIEDSVQNNHFPEREEDEIFSIIENAEDAYSLISSLHKKGYSAAIISRYSGIPEGEVKLVLNLAK